MPHAHPQIEPLLTEGEWPASLISHGLSYLIGGKARTSADPVELLGDKANHGDDHFKDSCGLCSRVGAATGEEVTQYDEHRHARARHIEAMCRKHLWLQFCEGIVKVVESSEDPFMEAIIADKVVRLRDIEEFRHLRAQQPQLADAIARCFPRLHAEFVFRVRTLTPMSHIEIDALLDLEQDLGPKCDASVVHSTNFVNRLRQSISRIPLPARYDLMGRHEGRATEDREPSRRRR